MSSAPSARGRQPSGKGEWKQRQCTSTADRPSCPHDNHTPHTIARMTGQTTVGTCLHETLHRHIDRRSLGTKILPLTFPALVAPLQALLRCLPNSSRTAGGWSGPSGGPISSSSSSGTPHAPVSTSRDQRCERQLRSQRWPTAGVHFLSTGKGKGSHVLTHALFEEGVRSSVPQEGKVPYPGPCGRCGWQVSSRQRLLRLVHPPPGEEHVASEQHQMSRRRRVDA